MRWTIMSIVTAVALPSVAAAQPAPVKALLSIERDLNGFCRGWSGDDKHTQEVCEVRDKATKALSDLGWCYGKQDQAGYQMAWHKCTAISVR